MNLLATLIILAICFAAMAVGLLIKRKALQRGCGLSPDDCACLKEGKDPDECEKPANS
ncbi:MAG TPA: hypothetical protein VI749_08645 [Candidatus Omnitrophota bacterium]|nr:hypothetical protein [Candidatus Omnitrophota bacterium]